MANIVEIIIKATDQTTRELSKIESSLGSMGKKMSMIGAGMTVGLTLPIVAFGKSAVKSAMESESALAELEAVLKSTGGSAGVSKESILEFAKAMQKVTTFSDETIMSGQSMLLTFTNIGKDVFPEASKAMLNMAQKFGDMDTAAIQLGKALQDPIQGVGALRRVGVMLTDAQEAQIKKFAEMGDIASAQKIILNELSVEFGGLAEAIGATPEGKFAQLNNQFDDLKETVGLILLPHLLKLVETLSALIEKFQALPPGVQGAIIGFAGLLAVAGPLLLIAGQIMMAISALGPVFTGLSTAVSGAGAALSGIAGVISGPVLVAIAGLALQIGLLYVAWKNNWFWIQDTVKLVTENIKSLFSAFTLFLKGDFEGAGRELRAIWDRTWAEIRRRFEALKAPFSGIAKALGSAIVSGISNGIKAGANMIVNAAKNAALAALNAAKALLGIKSPSSVFAGLGQQMMAGMAQGIRGGVVQPVGALAYATPRLVGAAAGVNINMSNTINNGMDVELLAYRVAQVIEKRRR